MSAPLRNRIVAALWPAPGPDGRVRPPVTQVHNMTIAERVADVVAPVVEAELARAQRHEEGR
jgi:hypothetical protein